MKLPLILTMLAIAALSTPARAQLARELTQLQEQQAKAVAAALDPVNRRYQAALEALLRRATQANDLQTAVLVNEELKKLGVTTAAAPGEKTAVTPDTFEKRLIGTKWYYFDSETITFLEGGKAQWKQNPMQWPWKVKSAGLRTIEGENLNKKSKWTITFDRDLKTGTLEGDGKRTIHRAD